MKKRFDWKTFLKQVAVLAIPVAMQNLLTTTGSMVDTMMIASLGENYVGAVGLCAQFTSLLFSCYWGFVGGGMLFFSQYWGARDDDGIDRSYGMTLTCMLTIGSIFTVLALAFPEFVMRVYTDKESLQIIGVEYLRVVGLAYIPQVLSVAMSSLLRSTERVKIPLFASIVSVCTNIFLNWVFIFGNLGVPAMGVRGAAIATACAGAVNALMICVLAKIQGYPYIFHIRKHFKWNTEKAKEYFTKCFPIICNELLIGVGNMAFNMVLGRQAEEAIDALAVFRTIEGLVIGFFAGFSSAASVLVGTSVGAGELDRAYERAKRIIYLCQGSILALGGVLVALHDPILHVMGLSGQSYEYGTGLIIIYCVTAVIRMGNWAQNDTYRSAGDAVTGTVLEITFMYLMLIPLTCLAGLVWKLPFFAVFICTYIDEPIRYILMQIHMYSGKWIRPVTPEGQAALADFRARHGMKAPKTWKLNK